MHQQNFFLVNVTTRQSKNKQNTCFCLICNELVNNFGGGDFVKCFQCAQELNTEDYCVCTKCRKKCCPQCAERNEFVCSSCGGDVAYLS